MPYSPPCVDLNGRRARMRGALLGTMVGDALGAPFEGRPTGIEELVALQTGVPAGEERVRAALAVLIEGLDGLRYTDDTQLMIGLARSILERGDIDPDHLAAHLATGFDPARGYGAGALQALERLAAGEHWSTAARSVFPDGSFGNGAAMRVAPVAVLYHDRPDQLHTAAAGSAMVTHLHPDGVGGAVVLAHAISLAFVAGLRGVQLHPWLYLRALSARILAGGFGEGFVEPLTRVADLLQFTEPVRSIRERIGNGVRATEAVPAAIAAFLAAAGDLPLTLGLALTIGGDTDTITAMAGALAGAYQGEAALPEGALTALAGEEVGVESVRELADGLLECWRTAHDRTRACHDQSVG